MAAPAAIAAAHDHGVAVVASNHDFDATPPVEEIVALGGEDAPAPRRSQPRPGGRHPQLDDWSAALSDHLDTRASITLGKRKGKVTIEFASVDDLHRIMAAMGVDPQA